MNNIEFSQNEIKALIDRAVSTAKDHIKDRRLAEAEALLRQTLTVNPEQEEVLRLLSKLLIDNQKGKEALNHYKKLLELNPTDFEALNNISFCYASIGELENGIECLKKCIELHPENPVAYGNLGIQYKTIGDHEASFNAYRTGIQRMPLCSELHYNYAVGLADYHKFDDAKQEYETAIKLNPYFAAARFNLGLLNLLMRNYKEGWEGYEWRFEHIPAFKRYKERFKGEEWHGEDGSNKTILVYNEQGAGDTIQFARFLPKLKEKGFKVIIEVLPDLVELISQCTGIDEVIQGRSKNLPEYDFHISLGSLPKLLNVEYNEDLWNGPYIKPTGDCNQAFESYKQYNKIGICWAGNPVHKQDALRSCYLKHFKPLNTVPKVKLFSLQKDPRPRFWSGQGIVDLTKDCEGMNLVNMNDMLLNFNYTSAIMKSLNHIITVDTAIAHLAGAMGLNCHLLTQHTPDWRWGCQGKTSLWYPSLTIVRQLKPNDYESRIKSIAYELRGEFI